MSIELHPRAIAAAIAGVFTVAVRLSLAAATAVAIGLVVVAATTRVIAAFVALVAYTGFSSEIGTKLRDWAVGQAGGSCYSPAALSANDSKTLYPYWYKR